MFRTGFAILCFVFIACTGNENKKNTGKERAEQDSLIGFFPKVSLPYRLSDNDLAEQDSAKLNSSEISRLIPDSIKNLVGSPSRIKYAALARVDGKTETYLIVKLTAAKSGAAILVIDRNKVNSAAMPFLIPDDDESTSQASSIDANYSISRSITRKKNGNIIGDGKDVFSYDNNSKSFSWLVHDALDENQVVNPIDALPQNNKLSGDYVKDKNNYVSVRDGKYSNQLNVFIHIEKESEDCRGELRGEFLLTSPGAAVFRRSGDPCVLQLNFTNSSVSLHEEQGCGNYRGLSCPFDGTFPKKKPAKNKKSKKTGKK